MAKLKVFKKDMNGEFKDFDTQGYINVVENLVETQTLGTDPQNLTDFLAATPKKRSDMLQDFANPKGT